MADWTRDWMRRAIVGLVLLKIAGLILVFDLTAQSLQAFDLPKALFSHALDWPIVALLGIALWRYRLTIVPRSRMHVFVIAYVLSQFVAATVAEDRYLALYGNPGRYLGLTFFVDMFVLYVAVAISFRSVRDWIFLAVTVLGAALITTLYALIQLAGLDPISWFVDPRIRPFSTLGNPNMYGHFLSVVIALGMSVALLAEGPRALPLRLLAGATTAACLATAAFVASRGAPVAFAVILAALVGMWVRLNGWPSPRRIVMAAAITWLSVIALALSPLGNRIAGTLSGAELVADRLFVYAAAFRAFEDRPLLGHGPDNFGAVWPHYRPPEMASIVGPDVTNNSAHDWILQTLATSGAVGLVAEACAIGTFVWLALTVMWPRWPRVAATLLVTAGAYWTHALFSVGTVAVDWVPWALFGILAASGSPLQSPTPRRMVPMHLIVAVLVAAIAGASTGVNALLADRDAFRAKKSTDLNAPIAAVAAGQSAVRRDAGRADYWNELGRARFAKGDLTAAADAFRASIDRAPTNATYWSNLATALASLSLGGHPESRAAALDAAQRAATVDPNSPTPWAAQYTIAMALGDPEIAARAGIHEMRLFMSSAAQLKIARAALAISDKPLAVGLLHDAIAVHDSAAFRLALARIAIARNDAATARQELRRALELEPFNQEAQQLLVSLGG